MGHSHILVLISIFFWGEFWTVEDERTFFLEEGGYLAFIPPLEDNDAGSYRCEVTLASVSTSMDITVVIQG